MLFSRYGRGPDSAPRVSDSADCAVGLHPPIWPNNLRGTFDYELAGVRIVTQDWSALLILQR